MNEHSYSPAKITRENVAEAKIVPDYERATFLHTGMNYETGGTILSKTVREKYLGVSMNDNMKVSEQCRIAASTGNQVLGMIRRNIT